MPNFDGALQQVGSAELKPMVKAWGGDPKMRKEECIAYMRAALKDPQKVKATLAGLELWESNALVIVKRAGGTIKTESLEIAILASGLHPKRALDRYRRSFADSLFRRGLLFALSSYSPAYFSSSNGSGVAYSDERILEHVGQLVYEPIAIQPEATPGEAHFRRPTAVAMDLMGLLQSIETLAGLKFTQGGSMRVSDETKLRRALKWEENSIEVDGFLFPYPLQAWLEVLSIAKITTKTADNLLVLAESPVRFAQRPLSEQIRLLMDSFIVLQSWRETGPKQIYSSYYNKEYEQGRLALVMALSALPPSLDGFFPIQKFEQALFQRIGYDFAFGYLPSYPHFYKETSQEQKAKIAEWHETIRKNWLKDTFPWVLHIFTTWLYYLGLVELVMDGDALTGFRLTELGRDTFHPELATAKSAEPSPPASTDPVWVVQPNFDIVVYMDKVAPVQLAFLERCGERTDAHKHTVHYRLTRESIYRGLENGLTLEEIIGALQRGSQTELSQNVLVELREWASLRERILLRRGASLLEFSSPQELNARMAQGLKGRVIAERFLLLDSAKAVSGWTIINYAQPLPKNLAITETGLIEGKRGSHDLITAAQLNQWAESIPDSNWQFTRASVTAALKSGKKLTELLNLLNTRLSHSLPPLLELALRAWAGKAYPVELEEVILMRCPNEKIFQAVVSSPLMAPLLKGHQFPDLLFADPAQLETLRRRLEWLGWKISE